MNEQIEELLPLYALGGLSEAEAAEVEAYLVEHPHARRELDELLATANIITFAAEPRHPAPEVKQDLLRRVNVDARQRFGPVPSRAASDTRPHQPGFFGWLRSQAVGLTLAGAFLLLALLAGGYALGLGGQLNMQASRIVELEQTQQGLVDEIAELEAVNAALRAETDRLAEQEAELARVNAEVTNLVTENEVLAADNAVLRETNRVLEDELGSLLAENQALEESVAAYQILIAPDAQVTTLLGTEEHPGGLAQMIMDPQSQTALLVVSGLENLPDDQAYQVLLIRDNGHDTAETFLVDTSGHGVSVVTAPAPLDTYTAIGVSIEPAGGSEQRTGDIVLLGNVGS